MSKCQLCLQDKELIKNSHIIPDFLYRDLYDDNHTLIRTEGLDTRTARRIQTGEKEGGLLCKECDNFSLGNLDGYAARVLFTDKEKIIAPVVRHPDGETTSNQCENINYKQFKLFLLSILWRASISRSKFFSKIDLGLLEETLRELLYTSNPLDQMDFPCLVMSWRLHQRKMVSGLITSPYAMRGENGGRRYLFQIGQLVLIYFVSKHDKPVWLQDAVISPENKMRIVHFDNERGLELMRRLFGSIMTEALDLSARRPNP